MIENDSLSLDLSAVFKNDFKLSEKQFESLLDSISSLPPPETPLQNENFVLEPVCNATIQMMNTHTKNLRGDDPQPFVATKRITRPEHFEQLAPLFTETLSESNQRIIVYQKNGFTEGHITQACQKFTRNKLQRLKEITQPLPLAGLALDTKCDVEICILKTHQFGQFRATLYKVNQAEHHKDPAGLSGSKRKRLNKNVSDTTEFFKSIQPQIKVKNDLIGIYYKPERASWVAETGDLPGARGKLRRILFSIHKLGFEYAYFCAVQRRAKTLWDCYFSNNPQPQVDNTVLSVFEHYSSWCKAIRATKFNAPACTIMNSKLASQIALYLTENNLGGMDCNIGMGDITLPHSH